MHHIRVISLDLDDTLWEIGPVIRRAEAALWAWLDQEYPRISECWSADALIELRMQMTSEFPDQAHDFRFLRKAALARVAAKAGYSDDLVEPAFDVFDQQRNTVDLYPDVNEALEWLARYFTVVAATNGNADVHRIGIGHHFDHVVTSVAAGAAKPHAAVFEMIASLSGSDRADVLHVGDHPETDVSGARNAGMRTVWMNRNGIDWSESAFSPDVEIRDMSELCKLLEPFVNDDS